MFLKSIELTNFLSFGPKSEPLELRPLNVLVGPNGSGKSNLIHAIDLLRSAPRSFAVPIRESGGTVRDWLWKGNDNPTASICAVLSNPFGKHALRHRFSFCESGHRFERVDERIESDASNNGKPGVHAIYRFHEGHGAVRSARNKKNLFSVEFDDPNRSILSQLKDPKHYPEITYLGEEYEKIRIYRDWRFGTLSELRKGQKTDERSYFLSEYGMNLGLVLHRLRRGPGKKAIFGYLQELYDGIDDFDLAVEGGMAQLYLREGPFDIPATRLSDGTLRYLSLLAILCHPEPPPLICIEEPELGLHPDAIVAIGELLQEASTRTQLIVTTHSDTLVDVMSETPESVVVFEKADGQTKMQRLNANQLADWLQKSSLGTLWRQGNIGGNRW